MPRRREEFGRFIVNSDSVWKFPETGDAVCKTGQSNVPLRQLLDRRGLTFEQLCVDEWAAKSSPSTDIDVGAEQAAAFSDITPFSWEGFYGFAASSSRRPLIICETAVTASIVSVSISLVGK